MSIHILRILATDGRVRLFTGGQRELEVLRNRLVFSVERDRYAVVRAGLTTERVEVHIQDVAAVGVVEPCLPDRGGESA